MAAQKVPPRIILGIITSRTLFLVVGRVRGFSTTGGVLSRTMENATRKSTASPNSPRCSRVVFRTVRRAPGRSKERTKGVSGGYRLHASFSSISTSMSHPQNVRTKRTAGGARSSYRERRPLFRRLLLRRSPRRMTPQVRLNKLSCISIPSR